MRGAERGILVFSPDIDITLTQLLLEGGSDYGVVASTSRLIPAVNSPAVSGPVATE